MRITIIGIGNVGLALGTYLSSSHEVNGIDIKSVDASFKVTNDYKGISKSDAFFISAPTSYVEEDEKLDTASVREIVERILKENKKAPIFIKSTVNIGFTRSVIDEFHVNNIYYTPEFLRQDYALEDIQKPDRLVIGCLEKDKNVDLYFSLFNAKKKFVLSLEEAEATKLFANTYLATRIAFFNELDTYAEINGLDSRRIIEAVCADRRIGDYYNKPSYGYGGYCLPKDSKELFSLYNDIPQKVIEAAILSNEDRKNHIVNVVEERIKDIFRPVIGVYGPIKKYSPLLDIIEKLKQKEVKILIYSDINKMTVDYKIEYTNNIKRFKEETNIILSEQGLPKELKKADHLYIK